MHLYLVFNKSAYYILIEFYLSKLFLILNSFSSRMKPDIRPETGYKKPAGYPVQPYFYFWFSPFCSGNETGSQEDSSRGGADTVCRRLWWTRWENAAPRILEPMVLLLDGNSEIGAHVRSNLFYLIWLKTFDQLENSHKSDIFSLERPIFLCATWSELPPNISNMVDSKH